MQNKMYIKKCVQDEKPDQKQKICKQSKTFVCHSNWVRVKKSSNTEMENDRLGYRKTLNIPLSIFKGKDTLLYFALLLSYCCCCRCISVYCYLNASQSSTLFDWNLQVCEIIRNLTTKHTLRKTYPFCLKLNLCRKVFFKQKQQQQSTRNSLEF